MGERGDLAIDQPYRLAVERLRREHEVDRKLWSRTEEQEASIKDICMAKRKKLE